MSTAPSQQVSAENRLLARLPVHERNAVLRRSEAISCASGDILLSANTHSDYVFFPVDAVVSMVRTLRNGKSVDVGVVGSEGMVGIDVFVDAKNQLDDAVVQSAGNVYRMNAEELRRQFNPGGGLQKYLLRFTNAFLSQVAQNALCNRFHTLDGRLARWLLMIHDRSPFPDIVGAPGSISRALGVEDSDVEVVLAKLVAARGIRQRRHSITVTGPDALEVSACECYETIRQVYERTLST